MSPPCPVGAVVLAAGEARRMGLPKLLLPWRGTTIIEQVVAGVLASGVVEVVVVVGHRGKEVAQRLVGKPIHIVHNPRYHQGMSTSLGVGVKALSPTCQGIMVVLGDQPALEPQTVRRLLQAFAHHPSITLPVFQGRRGHPVIFPIRYQQELLSLKGDVGARPVVEAHPQDVQEIEVDTDSIFLDIDLPQDYQSLQQRKP